MRVYLPSTSTQLRALSESGAVAGAPLTCFAVTPGLREHYLDDDLEELEYAASSMAARASLRLICSDPSAASRRIVISADVADADVSIRDDLDLGVVRVAVPIPIGQCASVHCDDLDAEPTIATAAGLIDEADLGNPDAEEKVDDADGFELCWYATQEIDDLLAELGS
ncbi:MAG: hypothetical protein ABI140_04530 [Jatrophihabitantaceae bacterium]